GATDGFIRRPFLYLDLSYGVVAGALALALLTAADLSLRAPLAALARSYGSDFALQGLGPLAALGIAVGAGVLGWIGAGLVTGHERRPTRHHDTRGRMHEREVRQVAPRRRRRAAGDGGGWLQAGAQADRRRAGARAGQRRSGALRRHQRGPRRAGGRSGRS